MLTLLGKVKKCLCPDKKIKHIYKKKKKKRNKQRKKERKKQERGKKEIRGGGNDTEKSDSRTGHIWKGGQKILCRGDNEKMSTIWSSRENISVMRQSKFKVPVVWLRREICSIIERIAWRGKYYDLR